ncbi:MAG: HAD-IIA family hydrolase [bacterium]
MTTYLRPSDGPLAVRYDVALLDLDGVVYVGHDAVPGAPAALAAARSAGMRLAFVTNNAARPPSDVVDHLVRLGVPARINEVVTSAQAAAHYLARRLPTGAAVLVVGTRGVVEALEERGLTAVHSADDDPAAVLQGFSPDLNWQQLAEGTVAIRRGVPWVATNLDATIPSPRGPLPGNGSLVAALQQSTGREPVSTGKPDPTMHAETVERSGARRPLVVGDRLDTDIEGATRVRCASLLVLTGVTTPADLVAAPEGLRPDYLAMDLTGLLVDHAGVRGSPGTARCGPWRVDRDGDAAVLRWFPLSSADVLPGGPAGQGHGPAAPRPNIPQWIDPNPGSGEASTAEAPGDLTHTGATDDAPGEYVHVAVTADAARERPHRTTDDGAPSDVMDALRALCWLSWTHGARPLRAGDQAAQAALAVLGLS